MMGPAFAQSLRATGFLTGAMVYLTVITATLSAQEAPGPGELARTAMSAYLHATPEPGEVDTGAFWPQGGEGEFADYAHPAGPTLSIVRSGGLFGCEMTWRSAPEAAFEAMAQIIGPAIQDRFDGVTPEGIETGLVWEATSPEGFAVEAELTRDEAGTIRFVAATSDDRAAAEPGG